MLSCAALVSLVGCSHVVSDTAPYYKQGPHQIDPPDGYLKPGTYVMVLGEQESYKKVIAGNFVVGHVWSGHVVGVFDWWKMQSQRPKEEDEGTEPASWLD